MHRIFLLLLCTSLAGAPAGCAGQKQRPPSPPESARLASDREMPPIEQAERAQRVLRRQIGPAVRVGYVADISDGSVRILGADTAGLRQGDGFLFLDARRQPIAYGRISAVSSAEVRAAYDPAAVDGGRQPVPGDLAAFNLEPAADRPGGT